MSKEIGLQPRPNAAKAKAKACLRMRRNHRPQGRCFHQVQRNHTLEHALRIYAWFLLVVTVLPAAARLLRPLELARILLVRYQNPTRRKRARIGGFIFLGLSILAMPFALRAQRLESRWLIIALLVGAVSSLEFVLDTRLFDEHSLARQNRYFGGIYAAIAIATVLLLLT
jgi:hypothetical protein